MALTRGRSHTDGPRGRPCGAPRGRLVRMWRAHGYSGPWLMRYRPLIYRGANCFFLPCGTMSHTVLILAGDVAAWRASDRIRTALIAWTWVHAIKSRRVREKGGGQ